jgi:tyrosine-protein phosphatase YwqE
MSWLKKLFGREEVFPSADLGNLKVDFHSHLIPGIDDGAKDLENSIELIKGLKAFGYKRLITTPHVMSDFYRNTPEIILQGLDLVRKELEKQGISIELEAAAEYYLDEYFEEKIKEKSLLTLGDNYVLFELPFIAEPPNLSTAIFELQTNGYQPILAHPERYGFWYQNFDKYHELKERGVELQLNILSLIGHYSPETRKIAERLIDEDLITFLGSDCHNMGHIKLMELARSKKYLHRLLEKGLLKNEQLL